MSKEIKQKIDEIYTQIENLSDPSVFTLNKEVVKLHKEISRLQKLCIHDYIDGICCYCGKEESND